MKMDELENQPVGFSVDAVADQDSIPESDFSWVLFCF